MAQYQKGEMAQARKNFIKAVDVTPAMAHRVIQKLKERNIQYVVAPYEADAQMTYLCQQGLIDIVLSEDSDYIPYGCRQMLFKMDPTGKGDEICREALVRNTGVLILSSFTDDMILNMCILSGCDYLPSIPGLGLKKAHDFIKKFGSYHKVGRPSSCPASCIESYICF